MYQRGFVSLIFVLGICITLTTWVSISSGQVFEYIQVRKQFYEYRDTMRDLFACADIVLDEEIRTHLHNEEVVYEIGRKLFMGDTVRCFVSNKNIASQPSGISDLTFTVSIEEDYESFLTISAEIKNGFIKSIQTIYSP